MKSAWVILNKTECYKHRARSDGDIVTVSTLVENSPVGSSFLVPPENCHFHLYQTILYEAADPLGIG